VDLGLLSDQAAMRHAEGSRPEGDAEREEARKSLQEDQVGRCVDRSMASLANHCDDSRWPFYLALP